MSKKNSHNYCGICGHVPQGGDAPNHAPVRWWDADDGWKIGTLCPGCEEDYSGVKPQEGDFAYASTNGIADDINTDEDVQDILEDLEG